MHTTQLLPLAMSFLSFGSLENLAGIIIPVVAIVMPFIFVITIIALKWHSDRVNQRLHHETIRLALEKGQPLPPELLKPQTPVAPAAAPKGNDRKTGLILIAVGAGLFLFFGGLQGFTGSDGFGGIRWVGIIPFFIGMALLINCLFDRKAEKKPDDNT